jgi:hypothetical protein
VASIFSETFHWNTLEIGLAYGGALSIGSVLGEIAGGMVLDGIIKRARRNFAGANPPPEIRLKAIWTGDLLIPAGLLIYGFTLQFHVSELVRAAFRDGAGMLRTSSRCYYLLHLQHRLLPRTKFGNGTIVQSY